MSTETLMTEAPAATPTEGQATSEPTESSATVAPEAGQQQQATSEQTTEAPPAEAGEQQSEEGETEAKAEGAPETYEFKPPEGREFDQKVIEQYSAVAKELNLSQEAAQKMLDTIGTSIVEKQQRVMTEARTQWVESVKADQEIGGEKFAENLSVAKKALDAFGTPELGTLLKESGLGDHPEIIRAFYRAGKAISEDGRIVTGGKGTQPADPAKRMFPNQT